MHKSHFVSILLSTIEARVKMMFGNACIFGHCKYKIVVNIHLHFFWGWEKLVEDTGWMPFTVIIRFSQSG